MEDRDFVARRGTRQKSEARFSNLRYRIISKRLVYKGLAVFFSL